MLCGADETKASAVSKVEPLIVSVSVLNVRIVDCFNTSTAEVSTWYTKSMLFLSWAFFPALFCFPSFVS